MTTLSSYIFNDGYLKGFFNYLKDEYSRLIWAMSLAGVYWGMKQNTPDIAPEIILGGIPVFNITKQGHASSDELLKYRSMGGIFLAHQKGGNRTFNFTARVFGPQRLALVRLLEQLQWAGREQAQKVGEYFDETNTEDILSFSGDKGPAKNKLSQVGGETAKGVNLITRMTEDYAGYEDEEFAYHKTIPIITETKIYTNMYLETLVYREDIRLGIECIEIRCAFRQFLPPTNLNIMQDQYASTAINEKGEKTRDKYYYQIYTKRDKLVSFNRLELLLNVMWAARSSSMDIYSNKYHPDQLSKGNYAIEASQLAILTSMYTARLLSSKTLTGGLL